MIKRCYLPVKLPAVADTPTDILANGKLAGEVFDTANTPDGVMGMAAIRLDALADDTALSVDGKVIDVRYPERLMPLPERKK